ncbi:MAG TPA: hypothetical protein VJO53_11215 [Candidatus Acidoferrales bacterium]|nr:hypothetical protein [Candidatus Acidoferrales bacterium]
MKSHPLCLPHSIAMAKNFFRRPRLALLPVILVALWPAHAARGQSQSAPPAQSENQTQPPAQPQSQTTAQTASSGQPQSLADAARKANAQKSKTKAKRVYTQDDLSSIRGTISVVGNGSSGGSADNDNSDQGTAGDASSAGNSGEVYWRGRARAIKDQIASVDQQIAGVKAEIAKQGPTSFDPSTGLSQNVIIVHDRNAQLKQLEDKKQSLEKQLDDLADEIRKAGGDSGWAR